MFTHFYCLLAATLVGFTTCWLLWRIDKAEQREENDNPWKNALEKEKGIRREWENKWAALYADFSQKDAEVKLLQEQVAALDTQPVPVNANEEEVNRLLAELREKEFHANTWKSKYSQVEEKLSHNESNLLQLQTRIQQLDPLAAELSIKENAIHQLEAEISALKAQIPSTEITVAQLRSEKEAALSQLRAKTTAQNEMENILKEKNAQIESLRLAVSRLEKAATTQTQPAVKPAVAKTTAPAKPVPPKTIQVKPVQLKVIPAAKPVEKKTTLSTTPAPQVKAKPATPAKDDLKAIRGVGPIIEKMLNKLGVFQYKQIAKWTNDDVKFFSKKLSTFQNRIVEDSWISNAKKQYQRKYGQKI